VTINPPGSRLNVCLSNHAYAFISVKKNVDPWPTELSTRTVPP
jgi:hypothetical protein